MSRNPLAPKDGWSSSGKLTVQDTNGSGAISLQADFPEADVYTVQFSVAPPTSGVFRAVATIQWTVEGNSISRQVDVGNGVSISAPSQAVRVRVTDATDTTVGGIAGESYGVTIVVTRGTRGFGGVPPTLRGLNPTGSTQAFGIGPLGNAVFPIPQVAGVTSVEVTASNTDGTAANLAIIQGNVSEILKTYKYADPNVGAGFVSVGPLSTGIIVQNLSTTATASVSVTFGIDG